MRLTSTGACGVLAMILNGILGTVQLLISRVLKEHDWPFYRLIAIAFAVSSACIAAGFTFANASIPKAPARKWLVGRGFFGAVSFVFLSLAVRTGISAGDASALSSINSVVAAFIGRLLLKEQLRWIQVLSAFGCICGAICISKPHFIFGASGDSVDAADAWLGYSLALAGGCTSAGITICSRKVPAQVSPWWLTLSATSLSALTFLILPSFGLIDDHTIQPALDFPLQAAGVSGLLLCLSTSAMLTYSAGSQWNPPAVSATVGIAARMTTGYVGEIMVSARHPEFLQTCGALLMLSSVVGIVLGQRPAQEEARKSADVEVGSFLKGPLSGA